MHSQLTPTHYTQAVSVSGISWYFLSSLMLNCLEKECFVQQTVTLVSASKYGNVPLKLQC